MRSTFGTLLVCALGSEGCFSEPGTPGTSTRADDSSGTTSSTTSSESSGKEDTSSSTDGTSGSGSTGDPTSSSSSNGDTSTVGACEFGGQMCLDDDDCGIPGICFADTQHCFHSCASDDDCPDGLSCFLTGAFGSYCVDCSADESLCAGGSVCNGNDCAEPEHAECDMSGEACVISDRCLSK